MFRKRDAGLRPSQNNNSHPVRRTHACTRVHFKAYTVLAIWQRDVTDLQLTEAGAALVPCRLVLQVDREPSAHREFARAGIHGNGRR